jgi:DNA-binding MarR family transcriptional regulator
MAKRADDRPTAALDDPVLQFMQRLWSVAHELQRVSKRMEAELRLTGPQRLALLIIGRRPGVSAGQLAATLHLHPATLTGVLARLERARLVSRRADVADARRVRLMLTQAGRAANRRRSGTVEAAVRQALGRASRRDAAAAGRVLVHVAQALHAVAGPPQRKRHPQPVS